MSEDLQNRIKELETSLKDALRTIKWFEGWLNGRKWPIKYDDTDCDCGHRGSVHNAVFGCQFDDGTDNDGYPLCECMLYRPKTYSVSYAARDVAIMKNSVMKILHKSHAAYDSSKCHQCDAL